MTVVLLGKRPQRARLFQQADPVPPNPVNSVSRKGQERAGTALIPTDPAGTRLTAGVGHHHRISPAPAVAASWPLPATCTAHDALCR